MTLRTALELRYRTASNIVLRDCIINTCQDFINNGLCDNNAEQRLCSQNDAQYWQQFSEVLLAYQLTKADIKISHQKEGPDFLIKRGEQNIWIEVICPEPKGLPDQWINYKFGNAVAITHPHELILLHWTSAIKEKAEKLVGYTCTKTNLPVKGYIEKGTSVNANDAYVIAINSRLLRGFDGAFPEINGLSQFPYAIEATFSVGCLGMVIDRNTLHSAEARHLHRPIIHKPNGSGIPADTFLDPKFAPISAIWAVDIDESLLINLERPMAIVHNPNAINPLPKNYLPAQSEYIAKDRGGHYELNRYSGLLR